MNTPANKGKGRGIQWIRAHLSYSGDDCLLWPMSRDSRGYGALGYMGEACRAHQLMCSLAHGPRPTPQHECAHSCGRGHDGCTNPRHLSWKTRSENQADRRTHGTEKTSNGSASRRSPEDNEAIRLAIGTDTVTALAARFKISRRTIERIRDGAEPRYLRQDPKNVRRREVAATQPRRSR